MPAVEPLKREHIYGNQIAEKSEYLCSIEALISDFPEPLFILDSKKTILAANRKVKEGFKGNDPAGKLLDQIVYRYNSPEGGKFAFFQDRWYIINNTPFIFQGEEYSKIELKEQTCLPGSGSPETLQNMISMLLHRFRSPITGVQGFADIMGHEELTGRNQRYLGKIDSGIRQLTDMLDELENLLNLDAISDSRFFSPTRLTGELIAEYPPIFAQRINIVDNENRLMFGCKIKLKRILSLLIDNALEYSAGEISVSIHSPYSIHITNQNSCNSKIDTENIFKPFYTTRADKMGLGLTLARLLAHEMGAIIQPENCSENSTTFSIMLPPNMVNMIRLQES